MQFDWNFQWQSERNAFIFNDRCWKAVEDTTDAHPQNAVCKLPITVQTNYTNYIPVHTKNYDFKDNYNDNFYSIHTNAQYRLLKLYTAVLSSATLDAQAL